jgi:putative DNA primase/helicase
MQGMRVVLSEEIPANRSLSESVIKNLTGGDNIQARAPYQLPYDFKPTHKLWMMGNHKPIIKDVDGGIWRRIHMIPFLVTIPVEERKDRSLMSAEFESELPGILNWAIKGLADLKQIGGLNPPDQVLDATAEYREESDQFGAWMNEATEKDAAEILRMGDLSENYSSWCLKNNEYPLYKGTRKLKAVMLDLGFKIIMDRKCHPCVVGLKIKEDQEVSSLKFN